MKIAPHKFDPRYFAFPLFLGGIISVGFVFVGDLVVFLFGVGLLVLAYTILKKLPPTFTLEYDEINEKVILERNDEKVVLDLIAIDSIVEKSSWGGYWPYQIKHFELNATIKQKSQSYQFVLFGSSQAHLKDLELFKYLIHVKQRELRELRT